MTKSGNALGRHRNFALKVAEGRERLRELAGHSVQEASIVYQRRFQNTPYLYIYQPSKLEIMKLFGKKTEDIVPERKNVWSIVIQVLIAALTALSGVFAGCSLASAWQ